MNEPIRVSAHQGRISRQAHVDLPEGHHEREIGRSGFSGPASHMIHAHPPTSWTSFDGPLRPRAFDTSELKDAHALPFNAPLLLQGAKTRVRFWRCSEDMPDLARDGDGDLLLFIHEGRGELFCDYGHLSFRDGDYLLIPRGTMWQMKIGEAVSALVIEAHGQSLGLPDRGLLGQHAFFDPALLETPRLDDAFEDQKHERATQVRIKARGALTTVTYPFNPLDAIGWKGDLSPVRLNWRDLRPITSARYHLPPSVHTTFVAEQFAVCTFCPRPLETDPHALNLPFFHSNEDVDELLFYHRGNFTSRDGVGAGLLSFHPAGVPHGPHPKAREAAQRRERDHTDEVAVMIDAFEPLEPGPDVAAIEREGYAATWADQASSPSPREETR